MVTGDEHSTEPTAAAMTILWSLYEFTLTSLFCTVPPRTVISSPQTEMFPPSEFIMAHTDSILSLSFSLSLPPVFYHRCSRSRYSNYGYYRHEIRYVRGVNCDTVKRGFFYRNAVFAYADLCSEITENIDNFFVPL